VDAEMPDHYRKALLSPMLKSLKFVLPTVIVGLGMLASSNLSYGSPKIAKETGVKPCTVCHTTMGKKELNKSGDCYKAKKDLKVCEIPAPATAK
jgi:hypothetical protein